MAQLHQALHPTPAHVWLCVLQQRQHICWAEAARGGQTQHRVRCSSCHLRWYLGTCGPLLRGARLAGCQHLCDTPAVHKLSVHMVL